MKRITDPTFKYVPAAATDIRVSIRREQLRLKRQAEREAQAPVKVVPIKKQQ